MRSSEPKRRDHVFNIGQRHAAMRKVLRGHVDHPEGPAASGPALGRQATPGAIFDLGKLRPFQNLHLAKMPKEPGINSTLAKNIHSIAIQVPKTDPTAARSTVAVYASASRQTSRIYTADTGTGQNSGPYVQVSRQANPVVNEVIILNASGKARADLAAILLTGLPAGVVAGFQNYTGAVQADMLRLNLAVKPTTSKPSNLGLIGGDVAGYPNGHRVFDDVTTIELRAIADVTYALVDKTYKLDAAAGGSR